ncbi:MAG TPA: ribosomal protein S18-alanine N-acetyltransferase [Lachnospiraceae bacterium]
MIHIEELQIDDLTQVMEIEGADAKEGWTKEGYFSFLIREDTLFLAIKEDGKLLGHCGVLLLAWEAEVLNVFIKKSRRREGLGRCLLEEMIKQCGKKNVRDLYLEVRASNQAAIHLYEQLGFKRLGLRSHYYSNPIEDAVLMSLECRKEESK